MSEKDCYIRTDLAAEAIPADGELRGVVINVRRSGCVEETVITVSEGEGERSSGRAAGTYATLSFGKLWLEGSEGFEEVCESLTGRLRSMLPPGAEKGDVLIAGLGNREITADAVGPLVVREVNVTRHLREENPSLFAALGSRPLAAIAPGVTGQTGVETLELVRGAIKGVSPSLVLCIDALASRGIDRLARVIQLTDSGIAPGSGVGNRRREFSPATLGVPVIAVGVPTVVDSSTLIYGALEQAGIDSISPALRDILDNGRSFFVTLKDADAAVAAVSHLIAVALNRLFSVEL